MARRSSRYKLYRKAVSEATKASMPAMYVRARFSNATIDHIVPISYGFKHDIPPELIGSPPNLCWMDLNKNIQKGTRLTPEAQELLRIWGYDIDIP